MKKKYDPDCAAIIIMARQIHFHYDDILKDRGNRLTDDKLSFDAAVRLATDVYLAKKDWDIDDDYLGYLEEGN